MDYEIKRFIERRGINSLYHFTGIDNLDAILKYGLLSIERLEEQYIDYYYNDKARYDNKLDSICTSISFPNYKMFYKIRQYCGEEVVWCVIEIDSRILWEKECIFCKENAASNNERYTNINEKMGINGLKKLFDDDELRRKIGLPDYFTTNPQAEVLVKDEIPVSYIKSINFNRYIPSDIKIKYNNTFDLYVDSDLFKYRFDFKYWR